MGNFKYKDDHTAKNYQTTAQDQLSEALKWTNGKTNTGGKRMNQIDDN